MRRSPGDNTALAFVTVQAIASQGEHSLALVRLQAVERQLPDSSVLARRLDIKMLAVSGSTGISRIGS